MKKIILLTLFLIANINVWGQTFSFASWSQLGSPQWRGRTFSKDAYTYNITNGGVTMSARLTSTAGCTQTTDGSTGFLLKTTDCFVSCDCSGSGPTYGPGNIAPSVSGSSLVIGMDWSNLVSTATLDLSFSAAIANPRFTLYDVNTNNNFADLIIISAVNCAGTTVFPSSVTGMLNGTTYNAANGTISQSIIDNTARGNGGSLITVTFSATVNSIRMVYRSNPTILIGSNPTAQFVYVGQIVATPTTPCVILPIELTNFQGSENGTKNELNWTTASEINSDFFEIERMEGTVFTSVGIVKSIGTSETATNYSFQDEYPLEGVNYYRLKQVDFDGQYQYSDIIAVEHKSNRPIVSIFQNPVKEELIISTLIPLKSNYVIFNTIGQIIQEGITITGTPIEINTLTTGIYFIRVENRILKFTKE